MVELATGKEPWPTMRWPSIRRAILQNCQAPDVPDIYPKPVQEILKKCFTIIPENRPHAAEVLEVFKSTDWGFGDSDKPNGLDGAKLSNLVIKSDDTEQ
eukprot:scaffold113020_cov48-Prasinocladus_malaysianus.AAC.1